MRYADAYAQDRLDALMLRAGRPTNSPGWGMLVATRGGTFTSERTGERVTITAGSTRVASDYWLAGERPELFKPADKRDTRTYREHRDNLERTRQQLERGRTRASGPARPRSGVLPSRHGGSTLRLPRSPGPRPLRLPR